MTEEMFAQD